MNRKSTGSSTIASKLEKPTQIKVELNQGRPSLRIDEYTTRIELPRTAARTFANLRVEYNDGNEVKESIYPCHAIRKVQMFFKPDQQ